MRQATKCIGIWLDLLRVDLTHAVHYLLIVFVTNRSNVEVYAPKRRFWKAEQTIRSVESECRVDVFFKCVSTGYGRRTIEKYLQNAHFIFCFSLPQVYAPQTNWCEHFDQ